MLIDQVLEYLSSNLQKIGALEEIADAFCKRLNENVLRPVVKGSCLARNDNGALLVEPSNQSENDIPMNLDTVLTYLSHHLPRPVLALLKPRTSPELINAILTHYLRERSSEPASLPQTIDSLQYLNKILVKSKWPAAINGQQWIQEVPRLWFANRQATVLSNVRSILTKQTSHESVSITRGIDIMAIPQSGNVFDAGKAPAKTTDEEITANVDDEDEPDGWGFDSGDDDVDASAESGDDAENTVDDAWNNWEDDVEEEIEPAEAVSNAFPYAVSRIPDGLIDIVEQILQEREQLLLQE